MRRDIKAGSTSQTIFVLILDSASTVGAGKTGIAHNAAGFSAAYIRPREALTPITLVALGSLTAAYTSGGWFEVSGIPGLYRLDLPDAMLAAGNISATLCLKGASGAVDYVVSIPLVAWDPQDATKGGLSNLDATISSRLATAGYTAPDNTGISNASAAAASAASDSLAVHNKFVGITLVAEWLKAFFLKKAPDATAASEINTGGGTYDATTDSNEAIRDYGNTVWVDPLAKAVPGAYAAGTAGLAISRIDETVSSRMATTSYVAPDNAAITAIAGNVITLLGKLSGITSLAGWLRSLARTAANEPASVNEINTGGTGVFVPATMSLQVLPTISGGGGGGGPVGSGAITWSETVYHSDGVTPLANAQVWVTSDLAGNNVVAGTLVTSNLGVVTFHLDAGTYYFWVSSSETNFANPTAIVVS